MLFRRSVPRPHKSASFQLRPTAYLPFLPVLHTNRTSNNSAPWFEPSLAFGNYLARSSSSSSSKRWQNRQGKDKFVISAKVQGLKSRAAFKLLEVCLLLCFAEKYSLTGSSRSTRNTKSFIMGKELSIWSVVRG